MRVMEVASPPARSPGGQGRPRRRAAGRQGARGRGPLDAPRTRRAGGAAALLVAYRSCLSERTRLLNQLQAVYVTAPVALRERIGRGNGEQLARRLAAMRARSGVSVEEATVLAVLRDLARRARTLAEQARRYEPEIATLVRSLDATLLEEPGVGPISAGKLLVCDPARFKSEVAFARCNGTAPQSASSGKTIRHRLSRGGDRQVNNALHTIALSRSIHHAETRAYLERKISGGHTRREAMRSLKRHPTAHRPELSRIRADAWGEDVR